MRLAIVSGLLLGLLWSGCGGQSAGGTPTAPSPPPVTPVPSPSPSPSSPGPSQAATWDPELQGLPRFLGTDYINLSAMAEISRFRSSAGHSYTDTFEQCRSMNHYFKPRSGEDWSTLAISSPVTGTVERALQESSFGTQVQIRPAAQPAFTVVLFHVNPAVPLGTGTEVRAGQLLGRHVGTMTFSDVAVRVDTPRGMALVSWFDVITDDLMARYRARGIADRGEMVITRQQRDLAPLACAGEAFSGTDALSSWVTLR